MQLETSRPAPPSAHRRALIIWLSIYPLVTAGQLLLRPVTRDLPIALSTLMLTLLVVPVAVYLVIPALTQLNATITAARSRRARPARR
ncbi:hypothetical protein [Jiangella asiatica]|uniref:Uncharacterized protein n=1 Tax=Jiangella asiatica TaxID=2530372 RepID=A0A4R5DIB3_9ACTN|nr:hypothetical protein [Jiangella asiatica]TDE13037.1 hypothetical protein E1269_06490 [Jiangella asiatica]